VQQADETRGLLTSISIHLKHRFSEQREQIGINLAAMGVLQKGLTEVAQADFEGLFDTTGKDFDPFKA
jgi:hypothetical protein